MKKIKQLILLSSFFILLVSCDFKDTEAARNYEINLSAGQETHAVVSNATGSASLKLVKGQTTNILTITGTYQGLSGPAEAAHWHGPAMQGQDGPIVITLTVVQGASPGTGTFSAQKDLTNDQIHFYLAHKSYINIHTAKYKKGEIRGQVQ